jgi:hypothetical protein
MTDVQGESEIPIWDARPVSTRMRSRGGGRTCSRTAEVPTAKWSELRYGLKGQLEDHDGEAAQA